MSNGEKIRDILIVGGGPAGTACAFRAKELGLDALIIDYDDILKRIRDYSKSKKILPSFGGGDAMRFPKGGEMVTSLHFTPIDKDDMCTEWKGFHKKFEVESRLGVELTGLDRRDDGILKVLAWDHTNRTEAHFLAKNMVLAIGCGVPRRFNIPGNTEGIAFRLSDPDLYVGRPALVIGGGTSAAEAVIGISNSKIKAKDTSAVYWGYRGDRLPRVSKALAEVFFEAYIGNGNIRYLPRSEPEAIVTAGDHVEYLSLRIDRKDIEGRPNESTQLEFPKGDVVACIGEDIPEALLRTVGIYMVHGGKRNKKRMIVTPYLETRVPNVYMAGDLLSQAYFRTEDFDADPSAYEEVSHRGNVKGSLRDGVFVANVIKQRMDGDGTVDLALALEDAEPVAASETSVDSGAEVDATTSGADAPESDGEESEARLFQILPNGTVESEHPIPLNKVTTIGRRESDINFPDDVTLDNKQVSLSHDKDGFHLWDNTSKGVFLVVPSSKFELAPGALLRAGRQFMLICEQGNGRFWFNHYDYKGTQIGQHWIQEKPKVCGREAPDITLDPNDMSLSRRHFAINLSDGKVVIKDLRSANRTFMRVQEMIDIKHGYQFQVSGKLFMFSESKDAILDEGIAETKAPLISTGPPPPPEGTPSQPVAAAPAPAAAAAAPVAAPEPAAAPSGGGMTVTIEGGLTIPVAEGQTICEAIEAAGIPFKAECHVGVCGADPIEIVSGQENMKSDPDDQEEETLEDLCNLEPGLCRLACKAQIKGPVTIKILNK
jgi:thioredoxin reductase/ferredoxin